MNGVKYSDNVSNPIFLTCSPKGTLCLSVSLYVFNTVLKPLDNKSYGLV